MVDRREFLAVAAGTGMLGLVGHRVAGRQAREPIVLDGLGEIRVSYHTGVLDQVLASGLRGCVVTVGNPALQGPDAYDDMRAEVEEYDRHIAAHRDRLSRAVSVGDLDRAQAQRTIGLVYYTQNATPIGDDVDRLVDLYRLGVRIVQLTYNARNLLGDGCYERTNAGLSNFGIEVVERLNELGMLVDVSHCGPATTLDGIRFSGRPVAITHAGCESVYDHPRNKSDVALRALADAGGVVGICQLNPFLGPKERNTLEDYLAHIDHAIRIAGIEHVGIGSDREYQTIPDTEVEKQRLIDELSRLRPVDPNTFTWPYFISELNHPRRMETIADALSRRGRTGREIDQLLGENFYRLFKETIG